MASHGIFGSPQKEIAKDAGYGYFLLKAIEKSKYLSIHSVGDSYPINKIR